jgi:hypothetical protein
MAVRALTTLLLALPLLALPAAAADTTTEGAAAAPAQPAAPVLLREVTIASRPAPRAKDFPTGVAVQPGDRLVCTVRISVDERGTPADVSPRDCTTSLLPAATKVARRFRFVPRVVNGQRTWATYDLVLELIPGVGVVDTEAPAAPPAPPPAPR